MDDKEKLVELLYTILPPAPATVTGIEAHKKQIDASYVADYLIYNCVTIREPGEWIPHGLKYLCSKCEAKINIDGTPHENGIYFCPNCGAPMKGENK